MKKTNIATLLSYGLFLIAVVVFIVLVVILEGVMNSFSMTVQRIAMIVLIVLPTGGGVLSGIVSFFLEPRRILLSLAAVVLNGLTFLYFTFLVMFAG